MARLRNVSIVVVVLLGLATLVYWQRGDWPAELRSLRRLQSSVEATEGRETPPLLGHVRGRDPVSLAGTWNALVDPLRSQTNFLGFIERGVVPEASADLIEPVLEGGLTLEVPGDWNTQDERLFFYRGAVWYGRRFEHRPAEGARTFLWFGAANYRAEVYLNGRRLGVHEGGFTPFNVEATEALEPGENQLVVWVDNQTGPDDVPTHTNDWLNYGGLTRDVLLVDVPATFVRNWSLALAPTRDRISGQVVLDGDGAGREVRVAIPELGVEQTVVADDEGRARVAFAARPELWSPDSPRRYRVEIAAATDVVHDDVGFRTIETRGREILLNGEPIFLRGISIHEEAPDGAGRAHSAEHAAALLGWARDLGCNFVRLAHYPHNEHMVRLADELGLLVWAEIPVYWNIDFENPETLARARRQLSEMIARDRNRAAVVFWSVANETPIHEARNAFLTALIDHVRGLDDTRLVTAAMLTGEEVVTPFLTRYVIPALLGVNRDPWILDLEDPVSDFVDVPSVNEYLGWYFSTPLAQLSPFDSATVRRTVLDNLERVRIETRTEKPVIISEFGAGALAGRRAPEEDLAVFSEEYQALVYRRQLAMLARQPGVVGMSPWILKDFRSAMRLHPELQDYWNRKGLVADDGTRKLAFEVLREHYAAQAAKP